MSDYLTREGILELDDIVIKEVTVPTTIPVWGGKKLYIRQLTRGQQDEYMKRQFGAIRMRQDSRARNQEIVSANIYGHDAWLCITGIVDVSGKPMFTLQDYDKLNAKSGEAIGWIATQIIEFSGMRQDIEEQKRLEDMETEIKNS